MQTPSVDRGDVGSRPQTCLLFPSFPVQETPRTPPPPQPGKSSGHRDPEGRRQKGGPATWEGAEDKGETADPSDSRKGCLGASRGRWPRPLLQWPGERRYRKASHIRP